MFFDRLNQLMQEKNISGYKLGKDIGISSGLYSQWKNNKNINPQKEIINKLSKYFNVSVDFLLGKTDDRNIKIIDGNNVNEQQEEYKQEQQTEIYNIYDKLNDTNKKILTDIGKTIFLYQKKNDNEW